MVLARPGLCVHIAQLRDRVTQALQPPVDVNDFVEVILHTCPVGLVLISVPVVTADFRCELNLQAESVQMPGGKEHVVESLGVEVCLSSIEQERFGGVFSADAQLAGGGQRSVGHIRAGLAEWIRPEELVARVVQFHSGEKRMRAIEILDHAGKSAVVVIIAVEGPVIAVLEVIDTGLAGLPTGGCAKDQSWPRHVDEGFTVVVPSGVEGADGLMLLAVANKVSDVHERAVEVRPDHAPVACAGRDDYAQAGVGVWSDDCLLYTS